MKVKVSAASLRLRFHPCDPEYIRTVCKGKCCDSKPATKTFILPHEIQPIEARGATVTDGMIAPRADGKCPFKQDDGLCGVHLSGEKPLACHVTPLTLNRSGTLIVTNRHKMMPCFKDAGAVPAYQAYRSNLDLLFGRDAAAALVAHLEAGRGDLTMEMPDAMATFLIAKRDWYWAANRGAAPPPARTEQLELVEC